MARRKRPAFRISQEPAKTNDVINKELFQSAQKYSMCAGNAVLFIYRDNKPGIPFEHYEAFFGKRNFIHLTGFKRKSEPNSTSATQFYNHCLNGTINIKKFDFTDGRKSTSGKLGALPDLLDFANVKLFKMGSSDLISLKNQFEIGLGNSRGIIGFDRRMDEPYLPVPVTVMNRSILEFVSKPQNVVAILMRKPGETYYDTLIGCINNGLLVSDLPVEIQKKLSPSLPVRLSLKKDKG